jgi:hypothetical protein
VILLWRPIDYDRYMFYPHNPLYVRRLDPSVLSFSLSSHRHPSICILFSSHFTSYNKQTLPPQVEGRQHPHQVWNTTNYSEYSRCTYNFKSHTYPSHSQTLSLSVRVPVPRSTQGNISRLIYWFDYKNQVVRECMTLNSTYPLHLTTVRTYTLKLPYGITQRSHDPGTI